MSGKAPVFAAGGRGARRRRGGRTRGLSVGSASGSTAAGREDSGKNGWGRAGGSTGTTRAAGCGTGQRGGLSARPLVRRGAARAEEDGVRWCRSGCRLGPAQAGEPPGRRGRRGGASDRVAAASGEVPALGCRRVRRAEDWRLGERAGGRTAGDVRRSTATARAAGCGGGQRGG